MIKLLITSEKIQNPKAHEIFKKMYIGATVRYLYTSFQRDKIKKADHTKHW